MACNSSSAPTETTYRSWCMICSLGPPIFSLSSTWSQTMLWRMPHIQLPSSYTDRTLSHTHPSPSHARHRRQRTAAQVWRAELGFLGSSSACNSPLHQKRYLCTVWMLKSKPHLLSVSTAVIDTGEIAMASLLTVASGLHLCTPGAQSSWAPPYPGKGCP